MIKPVTLSGIILLSMAFSNSAIAHSGVAISAGMHSLLHFFIGIGVCISLIAIALLILKCTPKTMKQQIRK